MHEAVTSFGILDLVQGVVETCAVPPGEHGVGEWMDLVAECSTAMTVLAAARDAAIVRLAAIESVVDEDGVLSEQVNGLGTQCLDAGAMVGTAVGCSAGFAEEMVDQAITRVVRVPTLHQAMVAGLLDDYKARCVASELTDVPVDLARTVVDALQPDFTTKSGPALRRRTRELLFRLSPDLLRERIRKARSAVGLRRWVGEPGTDSWGGSFPSERAATAWAAVDTLARRYRAAGTYPTLEMARAYALLDLVDGDASVSTVLHLTVPASALSDPDGDTAEAGDGRADPRSSRGGPDLGAAGDGSGRRSRDGGSSTRGAAGDGLGHRSEDGGSSTRGAAGDGPWPRPEDGASSTRGAAGDGPGHAGQRRRASAAALSASPTKRPAYRRHGDAAGTDTPDRGVAFVGVSGAQGASTTWMPVQSLRRATSSKAPFMSFPQLLRGCHPVSGALLDVGDGLASAAYVPGSRLKELVRERDGRCRFPGCTVPARSCDLDHVTSWPSGPTAASNLMCLCRRHHRVKQRRRWKVRLLEDAVVEWSDPRGRIHRTDPIDHLGVRERREVLRVRLTPDGDARAPDDDARLPDVDADAGPSSVLGAGSRGQLDDEFGREAEGASCSPRESRLGVIVDHLNATSRARGRAGRLRRSRVQRGCLWADIYPARAERGGREPEIVVADRLLNRDCRSTEHNNTEHLDAEHNNTEPDNTEPDNTEHNHAVHCAHQIGADPPY